MFSGSGSRSRDLFLLESLILCVFFPLRGANVSRSVPFEPHSHWCPRTQPCYEQALLASRRRPARSRKRLSAPARDDALRSRHEAGTRAGTPRGPRCRRLHHARAEHRHGVTRSEANPRAASQLRHDLAPPAPAARACAPAARPRAARAGACTLKRAMSRFSWWWWWVVGGSSEKFPRQASQNLGKCLLLWHSLSAVGLESPTLTTARSWRRAVAPRKGGRGSLARRRRCGRERRRRQAARGAASVQAQAAEKTTRGWPRACPFSPLGSGNLEPPPPFRPRWAGAATLTRSLCVPMLAKAGVTCEVVRHDVGAGDGTYKKAIYHTLPGGRMFTFDLS
eukprot:scaffold105954_cov75-Phaeocystis_antarctica.AAC.4